MVGLLSGVDPQVTLERLQVPEAGPTDFTGVGLLAGVDEHVSSEMRYLENKRGGSQGLGFPCKPGFPGSVLGRKTSKVVLPVLALKDSQQGPSPPPAHRQGCRSAFSPSSLLGFQTKGRASSALRALALQAEGAVSGEEVGMAAQVFLNTTGFFRDKWLAFSSTSSARVASD